MQYRKICQIESDRVLNVSAEECRCCYSSQALTGGLQKKESNE